MGARNTLLTHFSARYPRTSTRTEARAPGTLVLAIDGAFMRIGDMWKMPLYSNVIKRSIDDLAAGEEDVPVKDNW
jgi:ribonuclease Z